MAAIEDIKKSIKACYDAFNAKDMGKLVANFTDDAVGLGPIGKPIQNFSKKEVCGPVLDKMLYSHGVARVEWDVMDSGLLSPDAAFSCCNIKAYNTGNKLIMELKDLVIWKKVGGSWKVFRDSFTYSTETPPS